MDLKGILHISGKPGLYRLIAQSRAGVIVEELSGNKRFPVSAQSNVSSLDDIAIYTLTEEVPLREVFRTIGKEENAGKTISHKEPEMALMEKFESILPNYDEDRVYLSDIRKVFQWYNLLVDGGVITPTSLEEEVVKEDPSDEKDA